STGTGKAYGYPFLTWVLLSSDHRHEAYFDFTFSKPVMMNSFLIGDIDAAGLKWTYDNFHPQEAPGNSYQDEVALTATHDGRDVPIILFNQGSGLVVNGNTARSRYDTNQNYNVAPDDPAGTVYARSTVPFNTFTVMYSNGEDDALDEQNNPQLYSWWSNTHGVTHGASDNHAIRISGFDFCVDPGPYSIGNRIWLDTNNNATADAGEPHAGAGISVELKDGSGNLLKTTTTDANGRYVFPNLLAGTYQVCVAEANFASGGKLDKHHPSAGQYDTETSSADGVDRGDDDTAGGVCSTVMLLNNQEPTKEYGFNDQLDGDDGQGTPDANSNLTIDFGFVPPTDIELTKTVDKTSIKPGETVTYTLTALNRSLVPAAGVKVSDPLPARATLLNASPSQGTFTGSEWDIGTLPANGSATLTLQVNVK
ncbi:MAG: SdrD B-like domain-containing protein, partial [Thiothrix sp.]